MAPTPPTRFACIAARWFWILIYALIGVLTSAYTAPIFQKYILPLYNTLYYRLGWNKWEIFDIPLSEYDFLFFILLIGLLIARPPMPTRKFWQWDYWGNQLCYPSIFWSILLGGIMISLSFNAWLWAMGVAITLCILGVIWSCISKKIDWKPGIGLGGLLILIAFISFSFFSFTADVSSNSEGYWLYTVFKQPVMIFTDDGWTPYFIVALVKSLSAFYNPYWSFRLEYIFGFFLPTFALALLFFFLGSEIKRLIKNQKTKEKKLSKPLQKTPDNNDQVPFCFTDPNTESISALIQWIETDNPIEENGDRFHYKEHAHYLSDYLSDNNKDSYCLTILGGHGSGKTTLTNLIKKELKEKKSNILFVTRQTWESDNYNNTISSRLDAIIHELSQHVEAAGLRDITGKYLDSILAKNSSLWSFLTRIFTRHFTSEDVLRRISKALIAIDKRICVVIEDIDRNILLLDDKPNGRNQKAKEAFEGFLYRLKEATNISYILNIDPRAYQFMDLQKLSDKTFVIPKIKPELIEKIVIPIRKYLIEYSETEGDIDPCKAERPKPNELPIPNYLLAYFLEYPRILKLALRRTLNAWGHNKIRDDMNKLHGEIDLDSLLLLNAFQERMPKVFALYSNYQYYRAENIKKHENKNPENPYQISINTITEEENYDKEYIDVLFEYLDDRFIKPDQEASVPISIQGMANDTWLVSYFERSLMGYVPSTEIKDQEIIKFIKSLCEGEATNTPLTQGKVLNSEYANYAKRVSHFNRYTSMICSTEASLNKFLDLLSENYKAAINKSIENELNPYADMGWDDLVMQDKKVLYADDAKNQSIITGLELYQGMKTTTQQNQYLIDLTGMNELSRLKKEGDFKEKRYSSVLKWFEKMMEFIKEKDSKYFIPYSIGILNQALHFFYDNKIEQEIINDFQNEIAKRIGTKDKKSTTVFDNNRLINFFHALDGRFNDRIELNPKFTDWFEKMLDNDKVAKSIEPQLDWIEIVEFKKSLTKNKREIEEFNKILNSDETKREEFKITFKKDAIGQDEILEVLNSDETKIVDFIRIIKRDETGYTQLKKRFYSNNDFWDKVWQKLHKPQS